MSLTISEECRAELNRPFGHIIDGKLITATKGKTLDIINPATEETIATIPVAEADDLDNAVAAARRAFPSWQSTPFEERAEAVKAWGETYQAQFPALIPLLTLEQGKSKGVATFEFHENVRWFTELAEIKPADDHVIMENDSRRVVKRYNPLGVCAGIVPWNFPIILSLWKMLPALLMGNCMIIKPSPFAPLCNVRMIEAAQKHFPPGVLQCVLGDDRLGPWITEHPDIDKVAFTGSTATGKLVARSCSATLKRVTLELGGNDACIVLPDADLASAAGQALFASTVNSGQFCAASKRIYVHADIYDKFAQEIVRQANDAKVGPGLADDTVHGPLNNRLQYDRVMQLLAAAKEDGFRMFCGEDKLEQFAKEKGFFVPLMFVDNPPDDSALVMEETFGPIRPLLKWTDEESLLKRVNDSPYGLGAIIFGKDTVAVNRIARKIDVGTVWINSPQAFDTRVPFGGVKKSGYGYESGGLESLASYSSIQVISEAKI